MPSGKHGTVKLISAEGFEFIIDYDAACVSNTIKNMLSSQGGRAWRTLMSGVCVASPGTRLPGRLGPVPVECDMCHACLF